MQDYDRAQADNDSLLFEDWTDAEWISTVPPARSAAGAQVRQVALAPFAYAVTPPIAEGVWTRCVGLIARAHSGLRRWRATRRTIAALEGLDDHLLKDIGIRRCQIDSVARCGTFPRS